MTGLAGAVAFLTRVPVGGRAASATDLTAAVPWFPVVGALVGLAEAGVYLAAAEGLPLLAAATLAVTAQLVVTGAFHEDGLADTVDSLGRFGREERLRIMTDPLHGTFGVLALVATFGLRVAALSALTGWDAAGALVAAHAMGRAAAVTAMLGVPPAAPGLGASYGAGLTTARALPGIAVAVVIAAVAWQVWALVAVALAAAAAVAAGRWARATLGGITGDVLGATEQVAEISLMLLAAAAN